MKNKDYSAEIHALFEQMRGELNMNGTFFIDRMEILEIREKSAIYENSKEVVVRLKAEIRESKHKRKTFTFPYAKKKYTTLRSGKIKEVPFTR